MKVGVLPQVTYIFLAVIMANGLLLMVLFLLFCRAGKSVVRLGNIMVKWCETALSKRPVNAGVTTIRCYVSNYHGLVWVLPSDLEKKWQI